ncbi:hypothetical protein ABC974_12230 [Sphingomonas oligophenolica]|uniref:Uncharacterized protein n=1 Tax=Sphingomonas oligophenolica TaxID=301154 RepID=A0ABU9Y3Q0_9SPHN
MRLTKLAVQSRLRDFVFINYSQLGFASTSGALAFAGGSLIPIVKDGGSSFLPRIGFLIAGFCITMISLTTWNARSIFCGSARLSVGDALWPLAMGLANFVLFATLLPGSDPLVWQWFPLVAVFHGFFGFLLTRRRLKITCQDLDFESDLSDLKEMMIIEVKSDNSGTIIFMVVSMGFFIAIQLCQKYQTCWLPLVCSAIVLIYVLISIKICHRAFGFLEKAEKLISD